MLLPHSPNFFVFFEILIFFRYGGGGKGGGGGEKGNFWFRGEFFGKKRGKRGGKLVFFENLREKNRDF